MANGTTITKLEEARRRWGSVEVHKNAPRSAPSRGVAARFAVGGWIPRVTEQRRDISAYRLEREP